jgi:hypothetical protein
MNMPFAVLAAMANSVVIACCTTVGAVKGKRP